MQDLIFDVALRYKNYTIRHHASGPGVENCYSRNCFLNEEKDGAFFLIYRCNIIRMALDMYRQLWLSQVRRH